MLTNTQITEIAKVLGMPEENDFFVCSFIRAKRTTYEQIVRYLIRQNMSYSEFEPQVVRCALVEIELRLIKIDEEITTILRQINNYEGENYPITAAQTLHEKMKEAQSLGNKRRAILKDFPELG